ncbi:MAG: cobalamin-dependent protein [Phycisphaerales bacterium]|nr:cobalamin-dependent protein [Phycisphaerales bacterium]
MARSIRVLISKIGLDGHDRGAKLIVRNLRDAGMEVIYTGLWQTPAATVHAALQEDVDVVGVSLLSAAHMTIMPEVVRLAREFGIGDVPVMVGGIIPEEDKLPLEQAGIAGVFNPGTSMATIVETIRSLAERYRAKRVNEPVPSLTTAPGVARTITWISDNRGSELPATPSPRQRTVRIGITGAPGVGKSTFIGKLARVLRARGRRVGVVAVDPTSPITGGSLLGDRLRMMSGTPDDGLFVRSLSSQGHAGGLAPHTTDVTRALLAAGFEIVLIETVGAGQNDVEIRKESDAVMLLMMPGAGDSVQFQKAGVVEIATGFVVNKADLPGSDITIRQIRESLEDNRPIWPVSSVKGEGLDPICDWIESLMK